MKYFEERHLTAEEASIFSSMIFGFAAVFGLVFITIKSGRNPLNVNFRNVAGGIVLGVPNYFSIYFLIRALQSDILGSAAIFTLNNVAIVLLSTILGILLFQERLSGKNWLGIALAVVSIILVALF